MSALAPLPSHHVYTALADDITWFTRATELRIFHIATTATERPVALHLLALSEGHAFNQSPFFVLEDAHLAIDAGWVTRAERMAVIHAERRRLLAEEGLALAAVPPLVHGPNDLATFADQLVHCLQAQRDVSLLHGLVVVLAPAILEDSKAFVESLLALASQKALADVRWIVLELGDELAHGLSRPHPEAVLLARCEVDPVVYRREHIAAMTAAASAPPEASGARLGGGAGPKGVLAPDEREAARRPPIDPAVLEKELGASAVLSGASGIAIRQEILSAALAVQEGDMGRAVKLQAHVVAACAGMPRLALMLELILATYLLQAGDETGARKRYQGVAKRSEEGEMPDLAALAFTAWGASLAVSASRSELREAVSRYLRAGELATSAAEPILAVESFRMAGQLAARVGDEDGAIAAWKRGLAVASAAPPETVALTSGPLVARTLAKFLQANGSPAAAASLLAQADEMERAKPGAPPSVQKAPLAGSAGRSA